MVRPSKDEPYSGVKALFNGDLNLVDDIRQDWIIMGPLDLRYVPVNTDERGDDK